MTKAVLSAAEPEAAWELIRQVCQRHLGASAPTTIKYNDDEHLAQCLTEQLCMPLTQPRAILIQSHSHPITTTLIWMSPQDNGDPRCDIIDTTNDQHRTQRQNQLKRAIEQWLSTTNVPAQITLETDNVVPNSDSQQLESYQALRAFQLAIQHQDPTQSLAAFNNTLDELMAFTYNCHYAANPQVSVGIDSTGSLIQNTSNETAIPSTHANAAGYAIHHHGMIANAHSKFDTHSKLYNLRFYSKPGDINDNCSLLAAAKLAFQEKSKRFHGSPNYLPFDFWGLDEIRAEIFTQHLFDAGFTHVNGVANPNLNRQPAAIPLTANAAVNSTEASHEPTPELLAAQVKEKLALQAVHEAHRQRLLAEAQLAALQRNAPTPQVMTELTAERNALSSENAHLRKEADKARRLDAVSIEQASTIQRLETAANTHVAEVATLRGRAETAERQLQSEQQARQKEQTSFTAEKQTLTKKNSLLENRIVEIEAALIAEKAKTPTPPATREAGTEIKLGELNTVPLKMLEETITELEAEREAHAATKEKLAEHQITGANNQILSDEILALRQKCEAYAEAAKAQELAHIHAMTKLQADLATTLDMHHAEHATTVGNIIQSHEHELGALEGQIALLQANQQTDHAATMAAHQAAENLETSHMALRKKYQTLEKEHATLQTSAQQLRGHAEHLENDNSHLHAELANLSAQNRTLKHVLEAAQDEASSLELTTDDAHKQPFAVPPTPPRRPRTNRRVARRLEASLASQERSTTQDQAESTHVEAKEETKKSTSTNTTAIERIDVGTQAQTTTLREERMAATTHTLLRAMSHLRSHHSQHAQCIDSLLKMERLPLTVTIEPFGNFSVDKALLTALKVAFKGPHDTGNHHRALLSLTQNIIKETNHITHRRDMTQSTRQGVKIFREEDSSKKTLKQYAATCVFRLQSTKLNPTTLSKLKLPHKSLDLSIGKHPDVAITYFAALSLSDDAQIKLASDLYAAIQHGEEPADSLVSWENPAATHTA